MISAALAAAGAPPNLVQIVTGYGEAGNALVTQGGFPAFETCWTMGASRGEGSPNLMQILTGIRTSGNAVIHHLH